MTMKTIARYDEVAQNYINGNRSDFKRGVKSFSKKELLVFLRIFSQSFLDNDSTIDQKVCAIEVANNIIFKNL